MNPPTKHEIAASTGADLATLETDPGPSRHVITCDDCRDILRLTRGTDGTIYAECRCSIERLADRFED